MTLRHAILISINGLSLSIAGGLIFVVLILPRRSAINRWFAGFLLALGLWAYFAMARIITAMSPLSETHNFYVLFMGLAAAPVALYGFVVTLCKPQDGFAPPLRAWGLLYLIGMTVLLWSDHVVRYYETGGDRVEFHFHFAGYVTAVHIGVYLLLSYLYLHISPDPEVKPLRLPVLLMMVGYAKNLVPALRLPPLSIGLLTAAALLIAYRLLHWQLFNPLREIHAELRVANADLRQAVSDLSTEKARAERLHNELRESSRYRSEFLTNMGHQLRTPLNSIVGYSELLLQGLYGELTEKQCDRIEKIHRNGDALLELINDVIDLSKIEGGRLELNLQVVRIAPLAGTVLDASQPQAAEKSLALETDLRSPLRLVHADELRVRQVLLNLVQNAIKFTPAGQVTLSARSVAVKNGQSSDFPLPLTGWLEDRAWVVIGVEDTGIGIPPQDQAAIFEAFHQGQEAVNRHIEGAGLGLAISKKLVELHNGRIWVQSRPGEGSTFYVALPALDTFDQA
jgi:signal transduction histidine kinase